MTEQSLDDILSALEDTIQHKRTNRVEFFEPYEKQSAFFALGTTKRERMFMAGNQLGKTESGAYETALHLTGRYPASWPGRRFTKPVVGWAAGETSLLARDVQQRKLCGPPGVDAEFGTGYVPKRFFVDKPSLARGVTDAYDTIQVQHHDAKGVPDGISILRFKSYEQGRAKFQGETLDFCWCDEEPPMEVYSEILTRITATQGMVYITFTPLKGRSAVVIRYLDEASLDRAYITMVIDEAKHIPAAERAKIIAGYPAHEREARARGVPMLGSGRIFTTGEDTIKEAPLDHLPSHWTLLWGFDFGIDHPWAAVLTAWDRDNDVIHVMHAFRMTDGSSLQHAALIKPIGANVPVAWPQDGHQRDKGSGKPISDLYKAQGLKMLPMHAQFPDGSNSTEAGVKEMDERLKAGKLRVAAHLSDWFEEYRFYHRKDGMIVKVKDDILSATRQAVIMRRMGRAVPLGGMMARRRRSDVALDVDFDLA